MDSIVILDLTLTGALLLFIAGFIWFYIFQHKWLKAYGTNIGALITYVRRDNIAHQTCQITAHWTDPRTGRRCTFRGFRLDTGYQPGQLIGVRLDPKHPSRYLIES
jgi:hypothetical protein